MFKNILFTLLIFIFNTSLCAHNISECISFPIHFNPLNIPIAKLSLNGQQFDFVIDLGKKQALTLEREVVEQLSNHTLPFKTISHTDLNGEVSKTQSGHLQKLFINRMPFKNVDFDLYQPWGLWINASDNKYPTPKNTIGRDLFLNNQGILYYSHKTKCLNWCFNKMPDFKHSNKDIVWMPLKEDPDGIHMAIQHQDQLLDLIIDSAATFSLIKPLPGLKVSQSKEYPLEKDIVLLKDLILKNNKLQTLVYKFNFPKEFKPDGIVGNSFFKDFDLIIDTVNQKLGLLFNGDKFSKST